MFELEEGIQGWVESMRRQSSMNTSDIEELEDHLRESIAGLQKLGLLPEEALTVAKMRLGKQEEIAKEHSKLAPGARVHPQLTQYLVGYVAIAAFLSLCNGTWYGAMAIMVSLGWVGAQETILTTSIVGILSVSAFVLLLRYRNQANPLRNHSFLGMAILATSAWILGVTLQMVGRVWLAKTMTSDQMGEALVFYTVGSLTVWVAILAVCLIWVFRLTSIRQMVQT